MIELQNSQISQILPECLSGQAGVQALSFAINRAIERFVGYCGNISVFAVIDMAPGYVLDMLALDLNTQYYESSLPVGAKRKLIKNTLVWYMSAGTPKAVEELVITVFGKGKIEEWFEYGDDPYYFRIKTDAVMKPQMMDEFMTMLRYIKNTRSWLRMIEIFREIRGNRINIGSGIISCAVVPIGNAYQKTIEQTDFLQHAAALISCVRNYVYTGRQGENGNV